MVKKGFIILAVIFFLLAIPFSPQAPTETIAQLKIGDFTPSVVIPTNAPTPLPTGLPSPTSAQNPSCETPDIRKIVDSISENNIREHVANLVDDDEIPGHDELRTRASATEGNRIEAQYITSHYNRYGIENSYQQVPRVSSNNIIAKIKGKKENEVYIVGGHFDSVTTAAADDNGSGTAVVMEAARAIAESGLCPNYSIEFINFTGEELGRYGSRHYVNTLPPGKIIQGIINLDMVANPDLSGHCVDFISARYNPGSTIAEKIVHMDNQFGIGLNAKARSGSVAVSDHYSFEVKGHPAVFGFECRFNAPVYHKPSDTSDKLDYSQVAKTAKAVAAALAALASE